MPCDECKAAYLPNAWDTDADKKRKANGPSCSTCEPEYYDDHVIKIVNIYCQCTGTLAITPIEAMKMHGIEDFESCLNNVQLLASEVNSIHKEAKRKK